MLIKKYFLCFLFLTLVSFSIHAQDCQSLEARLDLEERAAIQGETMGQKLESLLFWSQEEKERRFPIMQNIFPSIHVPTGSRVYPLKERENITPQWQDKTTLNSYMKENHIGGVIVLQSDEIKLEKYADGVDKETLWTSFSMAKSVSSMLLGIALKEGAIESLDDPLEKYIEAFKGYDYGKVSVRQLLTMTSGIAWNEDYTDPDADVAQMYQHPCEGNESHILTYMKALKFEHQPGTHWNYSTGETDLVGILIQKATGKSLSEYLSEKIWQPWGMENCAYWLADECSNLNIGGSGLSASLRDYARLGTVMLKNGKHEDTSLFSEEYLENATSLLYETDDNGSGYGYLWWRFKDGSYAAVGIFGQMIYINPHKDLVIAQFAAWPKATSDELTEKRRSFIDAVEREIK
ncbi:CubicO group peptidase, beta-lactamase class C family [Salegentibacter echinorum]|uniref:CubicO group peptidase, beta-lactamase class C family n=1 Tax=Salegentibacter echinorum TaxID=1073325 RepID=A0A1M5BWS3_SALEC|nr:serine hydrolase [Salegentibacter echinorum]SHF46830.1 CubicO group peptidase, beta-lactamase class C family [Salegentibacter echinorum]